MSKPFADEALLRHQATFLRGVYVHLLQQCRGSADTAGACFYASGLLADAVNRFTCASARICGGAGSELEGGYLDSRGQLHGHYWVEVEDPQHGHWVLDITSDQFGGPAVVVAPVAQARATHLPGDQATVDTHVQEEWVPLTQGAVA